MFTDVLEVYRAIAGDLPAALVDPAAAAAIAEILAAIPSHAETFGFETRLAGEERGVDLGMALSLASAGDQFLANPGADAALARAIDLDERWRRLHAFGRRWSQDAGWRVRAPFLFLEFDGDAPRLPIPVPSVFIGLDWPVEELSDEARRGARESSPSHTPGFAEISQMITTLRRDPLPAATEAVLARCFASLPAGGVVLHLAVMLGRPGEAVRLSLYLPRADALPYFARLGWRCLPELEEVLRIECKTVGADHPRAPVQIDVDVGGELGLGFGVMLQPRAEAAWPALVDVLRETGLCDAERAGGLLSWPGARQIRSGQRVERYLAHAKLAAGPGLAVKAKAYIGVRSQKRGHSA